MAKRPTRAERATKTLERAVRAAQFVTGTGFVAVVTATVLRHL